MNLKTILWEHHGRITFSQVDDAGNRSQWIFARDDEDLSSVDGTYMTQPMSQTKSDIDEVESDEPNDTKDDDLLDEMRYCSFTRCGTNVIGVKYDNVEPIEISDHEIEEEMKTKMMMKIWQTSPLSSKRDMTK